MSGHSYDLAALEADPPPQEVRSQYRPTYKPVFWGVGGTLTVISGIATVVDVARNGGDDVAFGLGAVVVGLVLAAVLALLTWFFDRRGADRSARIAAFARANGLLYAAAGEGQRPPRRTPAAEAARRSSATGSAGASTACPPRRRTTST